MRTSHSKDSEAEQMIGRSWPSVRIREGQLSRNEIRKNIAAPMAALESPDRQDWVDMERFT
jgi:hypothetical protein